MTGRSLVGVLPWFERVLRCVRISLGRAQVQTVGSRCLKPPNWTSSPVRITTAFNRLLDLQGAWVRTVSFQPDRVVVTVALKRRRLQCPECSYTTSHRESNVFRWGSALRLVLVDQLGNLPGCG